MTNVRIPSQLLESILQGRCILFLGAGVSYEAGIPTSLQLSEILAKEANYPETFPHDLVDISEYYQTRFGRVQLLDRLQEILGISIEPSETHRLIANLGKFNSIITTNYDSLIEKAYEETGRPIYIVKQATDLANVPKRPDTPIILKLHGDLHTKNIILTREDYYEYIDKSFKSTMGAVLKAKLATGTFLFVGYSLQDYNFVLLFESVRKEFADYMPRGFAAIPSPNPVIARKWLKHGIELVDASAKELFEQISHYIAKEDSVHAFLSYSFRETELAEQIRLELEKQGIKLFYPARDIHVGENIAEKVMEGLIKSKAFIVLLSSKSLQSAWSIRELQSALSFRKKIIPILVEDCKVPEAIKGIKYLDARKDLSAIIKDLAISIKQN